MPRSITEIETDIAALKARRAGLALVPTRGSVGKTSIDLSDKRGDIDAELRDLRAELQAARSPDGVARRPGFGTCCS